MLNNITIRDFAIIDNISIDFQKGLHILTGETGSGKSIIIEAVSMVLGNRADTTFIRTGKTKATIELTAETDDPALLSILKENSLDDGNNLFILREIQAGGKSICRVNGTMVSVAFLNSICRKIADIHGQYDHQSLLDPTSHLTLLDSYDRSSIQPARDTAAGLYENYSRLEAQRKKIMNNLNENARNRDFMQYELSEIRKANLMIGEDEALNELLLIQKNSEKLFSTLFEVYEMLYEQSPSTHENLSKSTHLLDGIKNFSADYSHLAETVSDTFYKLDDLQGEMRRIRDSISFSPEEINNTQERIDLIERLKKKYGNTIENVLEYMDEIEKKIAQIESSDDLLVSITAEIGLCKENLTKACKNLTNLRINAAKKMEESLSNELKELNFKDTALLVSISPLSEQGEPKYTESGSDLVEFLIVTNKGEEPKPLNKVASGGEISRIMLAFKSIIGDFDNIPTLIFDEIDSGISGITASIVGRKMKKIAAKRQVVCITHLPQIAAFSDHHYQISKDEDSGRTITTVKPLDKKEKVLELARLLGGLNLTETAIKNAEELISESCQ
ncbi:DNA repair protein RecN [Bacillota bacterium]